MSSPQKWKLLSAEDVSLSPWFPIERRKYQLPSGTIIDDFTVTTIADASMIIPITTDQKVVLVNQYKPGVDEVMIQFPGGRIESHHQNMGEVAIHELEEETGIKASPNQLNQFAKLSGFSTKATELVYLYLAQDCEFNSKQNLDETENIEILTPTFDEVDDLIMTDQIFCAQTIAGWEMAKKKFPEVFRS